MSPGPSLLAAPASVASLRAEAAFPPRESGPRTSSTGGARICRRQHMTLAPRRGGRATSALPRLGPSARDGAPAAFDGRCISSAGVAARSHTDGMLARRALADERIARLGATRAHPHGLSVRKIAPPARALTMPAPAGVMREPVRNQLGGRVIPASVANGRLRVGAPAAHFSDCRCRASRTAPAGRHGSSAARRAFALGPSPFALRPCVFAPDRAVPARLRPPRAALSGALEVESWSCFGSWPLEVGS